MTTKPLTLADMLRGRQLNQQQAPQAETTYGPFGERYQVEQWQPPGGVDPLAMLPVARLGTLGRGAAGLANSAGAMMPGMSSLADILQGRQSLADIWHGRQRNQQQVGRFGDEGREMQREYGSAGY